VKTGEVGRPWERGRRIWMPTVTMKRLTIVLRMVEYLRDVQEMGKV
jgi:hypothetical protein